MELGGVERKVLAVGHAREVAGLIAKFGKGRVKGEQGETSSGSGHARDL
jgi:hypothetical protein